MPLQLVLAERAIESFGYSRELAVIISASAGFGGLLDTETVELFKRTGLYHVLVVSGSHVSFVFMVSSLIAVKLLSRSWILLTLLRIRLAAMLIGAATTALFVQFTGAEPPSVRALVALVVVLLAEVIFRRSLRRDSYLYVIGAMLVIFPGCFLDAGPILTLSAVLGLYIGFEICKNFQAPVQNPRQSTLSWWILLGTHALRNGVIISVTVWFFTTPWLCLFFDRFSPLSPLFNLVFGGLFSGAVCLGGLLVGAAFAAGAPVSPLVYLLCRVTETIVNSIEIGYGLAELVGLGEVVIEDNIRTKVVVLMLLLNTLILVFQGRKYLMQQRYCIPA